MHATCLCSRSMRATLILVPLLGLQFLFMPFSPELSDARPVSFGVAFHVLSIAFLTGIQVRSACAQLFTRATLRVRALVLVWRWVKRNRSDFELGVRTPPYRVFLHV